MYVVLGCVIRSKNDCVYVCDIQKNKYIYSTYITVYIQTLRFAASAVGGGRAPYLTVTVWSGRVRSYSK